MYRDMWMSIPNLKSRKELFRIPEIRLNSTVPSITQVIIHFRKIHATIIQCFCTWKLIYLKQGTPIESARNYQWLVESAIMSANWLCKSLAICKQIYNPNLAHSEFVSIYGLQCGFSVSKLLQRTSCLTLTNSP